jgi:hypothetical protein
MREVRRVFTAADACRLLETTDARHLGALAAALGCAEAVPLPRTARDALRLPPSIAMARVAPRGPRVRVLLAEVRGDGPMRDHLRRVAARLLAESPHRLWAAILWRRDPDETAVAVFLPHDPAPAVSALVVRRTRVVDSDGQTLAALAAVPGSAEDPDDLVHLRWADLLGRSALTGRFYKALETVVGRMADALPTAVPAADRRTLALVATSRQLFLAFLEAKGWLDLDRAFLSRTFDACMASGGSYHRRVLQPLWFGTLNTPAHRRASVAQRFGRVPFLNGGLFARTADERRHRHALFPDDVLGALAGDVLGRYRFTAREDARTYREAAVDPEMLGLAFESLMHAGERKASGAFYTPPALVESVMREALAESLVTRDIPRPSVALALAGTAPDPAVARALLARAQQLTVCDPACGSGAFLVRALDALATVRHACGDPRDDAALRRDILARQLHGVDRNPMAVWLCELRLWLGVVTAHDEPDPRRVAPLPNLDRHVRVGDALAGGDFALGAEAAASSRVALARERYARASGQRKHTLARALDRLERSQALSRLDRECAAITHRRRDLLVAARTPDLFGARSGDTRAGRSERAALRDALRRLAAERRRVAAGGALPFAFATHFATVAAGGGFDLVVGNPPWVRPHQVPPAERERLKARFTVMRDAAWAAGADDAGAGRGFGGQVDLAALFTERGVSLLRSHGTLAFVVPAKLWRSLAGGGWRTLLSERTVIRRVEDWSEGPPTFDAAVYPGVIVATRSEPHRTAAPAQAVVLRGHTAVTWPVAPHVLPFDATTGAPWVVVPPPVRRAFDALVAAGVPLARSPLGRPTLGVKCGVNDAYVVERLGPPGPDGRAPVRAGTRDGEIERACLRPVIRGEGCNAWRVPATREGLVFPHSADGPLPALPPGVSRWLGPWRRRLVSRSDIRASRTRPWWTLFRTEGARSDMPRVIWNDFGRAPRAAVLPAGSAHVPLNTCYVLRVPSDDDALAAAALLNSVLVAAWLGALAEPARGGWRRYLGWTVGLLPVPRDWPRAVRLLAPIGDAAWRGQPPAADALWDAVAQAYELPMARVRPLVEWHAG